MKKFLLMLAAGLSLSATAETYNLLSVHLTGNTKVDIVLKDNLRLSFTDNDFCARGVEKEITLPKSELVSFTHSYDPGVGIDAVTAAGYEYTGEAVIFRELPAGSDISVYTAAGIRVLSVSAEGDYTLPLGNFAAGVYVVSVNNKSFKINLR